MAVILSSGGGVGGDELIQDCYHIIICDNNYIMISGLPVPNKQDMCEFKGHENIKNLPVCLPLYLINSMPTWEITV